MSAETNDFYELAGWKAARPPSRESGGNSLGARRLDRRAAVGLGIVAAHVGLVVLLANGTAFKNNVAAVAPVLVTFLQQEAQRPEIPKMASPDLAVVQPVLNTPPPEVALPADPTNPMVAVVNTDPAPSPTVSPQPSRSADVPSMSAVAYLKQPSPHYPPDARRAHEEGLVVLRVLIDAEGRAKSVDVYRSSGHPRLDEAARNAVSRAVFKPYMDGGVAREAFAMIPIEFSLHGSSS